MVDWQSQDVQTFSLFMFNQMTVFILGAFLWYFVLTLPDVEFKLISRRLRLSWAFIPYVVGRWSHIITLLMLVIMTRYSEFIRAECDGGDKMRALAVLANLSLVSASTNLGIRALRLWYHNKIAVGILVVLSVTHWGFCIGVGISGFRPRWDPIYRVCIMEFDTARLGLFVFYLYTVFWDMAILIMTAIALYKAHDARPYRLWSVLLTQGMAYLVVTCITNIPMTVMVYLSFNYTMSIFFILPGNTISVIASSEAVTALLKIKEADSDNHSQPSREASCSTLCSTDANTGSRQSSGLLTSNIDLGLSELGSYETNVSNVSRSVNRLCDCPHIGEAGCAA